MAPARPALGTPPCPPADTRSPTHPPTPIHTHTPDGVVVGAPALERAAAPPQHLQPCLVGRQQVALDVGVLAPRPAQQPLLPAGLTAASSRGYVGGEVGGWVGRRVGGCTSGRVGAQVGWWAGLRGAEQRGGKASGRQPQRMHPTHPPPHLIVAPTSLTSSPSLPVSARLQCTARGQAGGRKGPRTLLFSSTT